MEGQGRRETHQVQAAAPLADSVGTPRGRIIMQRTIFRRLTISAFVLVLAACSGAKISSPRRLAPLPHPVGSIAFSPSGGVMADAVGIELFNEGFVVFATRQTSTLMVRYNLNEEEVMYPERISDLAKEGIDALLIVRTVAGYDGNPESVAVRVVSTRTGQVIGALTWQTGKGGMQGSPLDRMKRKGMVDAARQIGEALARQLRR